jgi:hypothetical protein
MDCNKRGQFESAPNEAFNERDELDRKKRAAVSEGDQTFGRFDSAIVQALDNVKKAQRASQQHMDMCKICSAEKRE